MTKLERRDFWAIKRMDIIQRRLRIIQREINEMKADLGRAGFKVDFFGEGITTTCRILPKKDEYQKEELRTKAELAEDDYNIPLLGQYLALRRAHAIVILDNKEG